MFSQISGVIQVGDCNKREVSCSLMETSINKRGYDENLC